MTTTHRIAVIRGDGIGPDEMAAGSPDIEAECLYVDAAAQALVMNPEHIELTVTQIRVTAAGGAEGGPGPVAATVAASLSNVAARAR